MGRVIAIAGVGFLGLAWLLGASGARINTTGSVPVGLYWATEGGLERGDYVMFCPPRLSVFDLALARGYIASGQCVGGYGLMLKRVAALEGDTIDINAEGVWVNGALQDYTAQRRSDPRGRELPTYSARNLRVENGSVLLVSEHSDLGFDARYFGPLRLTAASTWERLRPVWTF